MDNIDFIKQFSKNLRNHVHPVIKTEQIQKESCINTICQILLNENKDKYNKLKHLCFATFSYFIEKHYILNV